MRNRFLAQSVKLLNRAMGEEPVITVKHHTDEKGVDHATITEEQAYDPKHVKAALQLIGQHKDVQAFAITVEHSHTHKLEQRLAARSKVIEGRALNLGADNPAGLPHIVDDREVIEVNGSYNDDDAIKVENGQESQKRVHSARKDEMNANEAKPAFDARGQRPNEYIDKSKTPDIPESVVSTEKKFLGVEKPLDPDRVIKRRRKKLKAGEEFVRKYSGKPSPKLGV